MSRIDPPPKTTAVEAGSYYATGFVGPLFGFSGEWARRRCKAGLFLGAKRLPGGKSWIIPGAAVLALIGREQQDRDRLAEAVAVPTPAERKRRANAAAKELDKLNGTRRTRAKGAESSATKKGGKK